MANIGLLAGLGAGFDALGKSVMDQQRADRAMALAQRKAQLAAQSQMQLLQAKQAFMQQNPQYKHFITTPTGNVVAIDQFGQPKQAYSASNDDKDILKQKRDADAAYLQSKRLATDAQAGLVAAKTPLEGGLIKAQTGLAQARTEAALRDKNPKGPKDPFAVSPTQMEALRQKELGNFLSAPEIKYADPNDPAVIDAKAKADASLKAKGYHIGSAPAAGLAAPGLGAFGALVPQSDEEPTEQGGVTTVPDDDEDSDFLN